MSHELHFENHPEPVIVADGYGFKAPKSWGKQLRSQPCCPDEDNLVLDIGRNPLNELDRRIQEEQDKLSRVVEENEAEMLALQTSIAQLDIRALTASGPQRLEMLASQRFLKTRDYAAARTKSMTETAHQRERVERLQELRSRKRKELSQ